MDFLLLAFCGVTRRELTSAVLFQHEEYNSKFWSNCSPPYIQVRVSSRIGVAFECKIASLWNRRPDVGVDGPRRCGRCCYSVPHPRRPSNGVTTSSVNAMAVSNRSRPATTTPARRPPVWIAFGDHGRSFLDSGVSVCLCADVDRRDRKSIGSVSAAGQLSIAFSGNRTASRLQLMHLFGIATLCLLP